MMTEKLLHFIWRFQYFDIHGLTTTNGQPVHIINPGLHNFNQGPDFLNAKIRIGNTTWAGNVELHVHASDWNQHQHSQDENYDNVILHVVWKEDKHVALPFPTLELFSKVPGLLLSKYASLMNSRSFIPCEKMISAVNDVVLASWKDRLLIERLVDRSNIIKQQWEKNKRHWEEVFFWKLAANFGAKVNSESFEKIAQTIPFNVLNRHHKELFQVEALLFGQSGLLATLFTEEYPVKLQKEHKHLQKKYNLKPAAVPLYLLRMRPANFPTVRIAQLAMILNKKERLFASLREENDLSRARQLFEVCAGEYWDNHFRFNQCAAYNPKRIGEMMIDNIFINTVIPFLFSYAMVNNRDSLKQKAIDWMVSIPPERNIFIKKFSAIGLSSKNAMDSQAMIQLKKKYCDQSLCLQCAIGKQVLSDGLGSPHYSQS